MASFRGALAHVSVHALAVVALAASVGAAAGADTGPSVITAATPAPSALLFRGLVTESVAATLSDRGFFGIEAITRRGERFLATALDPRGNRVRLALAARTGEILEVTVIGHQIYPSGPHPAHIYPAPRH